MAPEERPTLREGRETPSTRLALLLHRKNVLSSVCPKEKELYPRTKRAASSVVSKSDPKPPQEGAVRANHGSVICRALAHEMSKA